MKKLSDFRDFITPLLKIEDSDFSEIVRSLKDQSRKFDQFAQALDKEEPSLHDTDKGRFRSSITEVREIAPEAHSWAGKSGPGGGTNLEPFHVAFFLIAFMSGSARRNLGAETWKCWHIPQKGSELSGWGDDWKPTLKLCPFTGKVMAGDALVAILGDPALAKRVRNVRVDIGYSVEIDYDKDKQSVFEISHPGARFFRNKAELDGMVIKALSQFLHG